MHWGTDHEIQLQKQWQKYTSRCNIWGLPRWLGGKEFTCRAGDPDSISGSGRSPGGGNGNPLYYSCLGNPMDRGAWRATVHRVSKSWTQAWRAAIHGVAKSRTRLSDWTELNWTEWLNNNEMSENAFTGAAHLKAGTWVSSASGMSCLSWNSNLVLEFAFLIPSLFSTTPDLGHIPGAAVLGSFFWAFQMNKPAGKQSQGP